MIVNSGDAGGGYIFVPEEFVLLPKGENIPPGPDGEGLFLVLDEVAIDHEIEVVAGAVVRPEGEVG